MKNLFARLIGVTVTCAVLAGCAGLGVGGRSGSATVSHAVTPWLPLDAEWHAAQGADGVLHVAYYDQKRFLHLVTADRRQGSPVRPFHDTGSERASSGLALVPVDNRLFVAFRDKSPERDLFVADVSDVTGAKKPPLLGVGAATIPLAAFELLPRQGRLGVLWHGEKGHEGQAHHIYYRELVGGALAPGEPVRLFAGVYPVGAVTDDDRLTAFSWIRDAAGSRIVARTQQGAGAFGPEVSIATVNTITPLFVARAVGKRTFVFWNHYRGRDAGGYRIEGAVSDDGVNWQRIVFEALDGYDIESMDFAADGAGNVALAVAAVRPGDSVAKGKREAFLLRSHDNGVTWTVPERLRPTRDDQPLYAYSHARTPKVVFLAPARLIVAWEDWRTLRGGIRYSYSEDAGRNWVVGDAPLMGGVATNEKLSIQKPSIFHRDGRLQLIAEQMNGDLLTEKRLVLLDLSIDALKQPTATADAQGGSAERLKQRLHDYWQALVRRDHDAVYAFFDPFFRARVSLQDYRKMVSPVEYSDPRDMDVQVDGVLAHTVTKVDVEIKPVQIGARTIKLDKHERVIPSRWIWIDGDWYNEFYLESRDYRYTNY